MKNRIKEVRKSFQLSQDSFGKRLGITGASVSRLESGDREPSDQTVLSICREFGVSRLWLEHGEGPMLSPQADSDIAVITRAMEGQSEAKKRLIRLIAEMPDELLDAFISYMEGRQ